MTRQALIILSVLLFAGCSQTTTHGTPTSSHQVVAGSGVLINSTLPGTTLAMLGLTLK